MRVKIYLFLLLILLVSILFRVHVIKNLLINSFIIEPLFLTDLLGKGIAIPWRIIFFLDLCNIFLLFIIGKKILSPKLGLVSSFLYGISPWAAYSQLFGSIYIFLLSFFIIFSLGILMLREKNIKGIPIAVLGSAVLLYSSLLDWFILPVVIFTIYKLKLIKINYLKILIFIIIILFLPLIWLSSKNLTGFINVLNNQIEFLSDPGIKNTINQFKGESNESSFIFLSKVSENKYVYIFKYFILKLTKNLAPSTFFTPQEKIFNFSFSPPIYVGFLFPFLYGLVQILKFYELRKYLVFSIIFILPSFFSKSLVDLNRLILIYPIIILMISFGLVNFYKLKNPTLRLVLYLSLLLVLLQVAITNLDIGLREHQRYILSI